MANQDKERAEFETSYKNKHSMATTIRLASGRYYSTLVESARQDWQTSAERSAKRIAELDEHLQSLADTLEALLIDIDNTPLEIRIIKTAVAAQVKLEEFKATKGGA